MRKKDRMWVKEREVFMDQEEALQKLQKTRRENEEAYLKAKSFMDGFRARGQLSQKDN